MSVTMAHHMLTFAGFLELWLALFLDAFPTGPFDMLIQEHFHGQLKPMQTVLTINTEVAMQHDAQISSARWRNTKPPPPSLDAHPPPPTPKI